ncbi:enolase-phosphatase E1-like [Mya arenaria]|uniref:enolase-phosphatase E1-like n=1 Tax=Mya arenaria TaxID=6604 RepID=UPI0022E155AC|nr:enolase-phosphatase E1-like [Mya arenaria]
MPPPTEKRTLEEAESILEGVKAVVLDIEGTITPISFVKDKLFPYIRENIETYLTSKFDDDETKADITALRDLAKKDKEGGADVVEIPDSTDDNEDAVVKAVVKNVIAQMDADRKSTELKQLQGHMWREAYKTKKVEGELFEDVGPVLQQLCEEDFRIYIYSSGSVEAQKLLIANSTDGDLTEIFSGFFDTNVGPKTEAESYKTIRAEIIKDFDGESVDVEEILFLTDSPDEAKAARLAGWVAILVDRSLEQEDSIEIDEATRQSFQVIENLHDLFGDDDLDEMEGFDGQVKRVKLAANGEFDDDDEDDEDEVDDDGEEDEEAEDFAEDEEAGEDGEEEEEA